MTEPRTYLFSGPQVCEYFLQTVITLQNSMCSWWLFSPLSCFCFFTFNKDCLILCFRLPLFPLFTSYKHYYNNCVSESQICVCSPCLSYPCFVNVFPKLLLLLTLTQVHPFLLLSLWKISRCFPFCMFGFGLSLPTDSSSPIS